MIKENEFMDTEEKRRDIKLMRDPEWKNKFEPLIFFGNAKDFNELLDQFENYVRGRKEVNEIPPSFISINVADTKAWIYLNHLADENSLSESTVYDIYFQLKSSDRVCTNYLSAPTQEEVNHPARYNKGGIEVFDILKAYMGKEDTMAFDIGCVIKYVLRFKDKGGLEDLKKARVYLDHYILLAEEDK